MLNTPEWIAAETAVEASEQHRRDCWWCCGAEVCDEGRQLLGEAHRLIDLADRPVPARVVREIA
jgi:hypothetical protein